MLRKLKTEQRKRAVCRLRRVPVVAVRRGDEIINDFRMSPQAFQGEDAGIPYAQEVPAVRSGDSFWPPPEAMAIASAEER